MAGVPAPPSDGEMGAWLFRVGMCVIGFFLCLGVRDAKKSLDEVPNLKAKVETMQDAQTAIFRRLEKLEGFRGGDA